MFNIDESMLNQFIQMNQPIDNKDYYKQYLNSLYQNQFFIQQQRLLNEAEHGKLLFFKVINYIRLIL